MADDLDDLLDEVESKFCKDNGTKKPARTNSSQQRGETVKHAQTSR